MKYRKVPLTLVQQADRLISRGLKAERDLLISHLKNVNYYRFSEYLHPFKMHDNNFRPGTTFEMVWRRYTFDRRLRVLLLDAIERVEVAIRSQLAYHFSHSKGPFGHIYTANLPKLPPEEHDEWLMRLKDETERSRETFVANFKEKYGNHHIHLPLWISVEIMSFGMLLTFFRGVEPKIMQKIAAEFDIPDMVLLSWLGSLNVIRNICAHHARMWNRELGYKPFIPRRRKYPDWHVPVEIRNNRAFGILTILNYILNKIAPPSRWTCRLLELLKEFNEIPLTSMGFPKGWMESPIWIKGKNN